MFTADFLSPHEPLDRPGVVAYLGAPRPAESASLEAAVRDFAAQNGMGTVNAVYQDTGPLAGGNLGTGFDRCLAALLVGRARRVVLRAGTDKGMRSASAAWVRAAGGEVFWLDGAAPCL